MQPTRALCKLIAVEFAIALAAFAWACALDVPEQKIIAGAVSTQLPPKQERGRGENVEDEQKERKLDVDRVSALHTHAHVDVRADQPGRQERQRRLR